MSSSSSSSGLSALVDENLSATLRPAVQAIFSARLIPCTVKPLPVASSVLLLASQRIFPFLIVSGEDFLARWRSGDLEDFLTIQKPTTILIHGIHDLIQFHRSQGAQAETENSSDFSYSFSALSACFAELWISSGGARHCRATGNFQETLEFLARAIENARKFLNEQEVEESSESSNFPTLVSEGALSLVKTGKSAAMRGSAMPTSGASRFVTLSHTWINFLSILPGLSEEKSRAVCEKYSSLAALMAAYKKCDTTAERASLLADLPLPLSGTGKFRRLGPSVSRTIYGALCVGEPRKSSKARGK